MILLTPVFRPCSCVLRLEVSNGRLTNWFLSPSSRKYQVSVPNIKPGQVVVMDNVPFHKSKAVLCAFDEAWIPYVFLPPYSPDLPPIEEMWSKVKNYLKRQAARTAKTFDDAISNILKSITINNVEGWYQYSGYVASQYETRCNFLFSFSIRQTLTACLSKSRLVTKNEKIGLCFCFHIKPTIWIINKVTCPTRVCNSAFARLGPSTRI